MAVSVLHPIFLFPRKWPYVSPTDGFDFAVSLYAGPSRLPPMLACCLLRTRTRSVSVYMSFLIFMPQV